MIKKLLAILTKKQAIKEDTDYQARQRSLKQIKEASKYVR